MNVSTQILKILRIAALSTLFSSCGENPTDVDSRSRPRFTQMYEDCPDCRTPSQSEVSNISAAINLISSGNASQCAAVRSYITQFLSPMGWSVSDYWLGLQGYSAGHYDDHGPPHFMLSWQRANGYTDDLARSITHEVSHHLWGYDEASAWSLAYTCTPV
jgi:hypothetical protein